ncbi:MAG: RidA family protein [Actinomycetota bacterium]
MAGRTLISSGSPFEASIGFSRAVRVGQNVSAAGTAPVMPGGADPPADAYGQAMRCIDIIRDALEQAGAQLRHVIRTTIYLTTGDAAEGVSRAHGEVFGDIRPAATMVVVERLLDERWLVEISADALIHDRG